jgi:hypothetical protein
MFLKRIPARTASEAGLSSKCQIHILSQPICQGQGDEAVPPEKQAFDEASPFLTAKEIYLVGLIEAA